MKLKARPSWRVVVRIWIVGLREEAVFAAPGDSRVTSVMEQVGVGAQFQKVAGMC